MNLKNETMSEKEFITNDLSFAAYLIMHGIPILRAEKLKNTFRFEFFYTDDIEQLKLTYITSESARFDDHVRKLKKLVHGDRYR